MGNGTKLGESSGIPVSAESPGVQSYLTILQGVINRMAANSAASKTWCIALVCAIVVLIADKGRPEYANIAMMPIALFAFLDAYYLSLEKRFRDHYNVFIDRVHGGTAVVTDLYIVTPGKGAKIFWSCLGEAFFSLSVWPFYGLLAGFVLIAQRWFLS